MSTESPSKADLLTRVEQTRDDWEAFVAAAAAIGYDKPGAAGDWSFKDVAGHLNGWRIRTVDRMEAAVQDTAPTPPPWPAELTDETDEGVDAINQWLFERYRDRSIDDILTEARDQYRRILAATELLTEEQLFTPGRYSWLDGYPLSEVANGTCEHLYEEHEPALRAWLAQG